MPCNSIPIDQQNKNDSRANAKAAFKNFTLSKLSTSRHTRTYIPKGEDVTAKQKSLISQQLADMPPTTSAGPGLTLTIADPTQLNVKDGKIELSILVAAMDKAKPGTQFYTSGTSLTEQIDIQQSCKRIQLITLEVGRNSTGPFLYASLRCVPVGP
jgi:hypothetical protein